MYAFVHSLTPNKKTLTLAPLDTPNNTCHLPTLLFFFSFVGKFSSSDASLGCDTCDIGFDSTEGSVSCVLAAVTYYITKFTPNVDTARCPANADCAGGEQAPAPKRGFWVDRSSYDYADVM